MHKITLLICSLLFSLGVINAQTVKKAAPGKKTVHKKTFVTKKAVVTNDDGDDDEDYYSDDEDGDDVEYVVVASDDDNDYYVADEDGDNDDDMAVNSPKHTSRKHIYSHKYPKELYYYNAKTGYYYKRHTPLKK